MLGILYESDEWSDWKLADELQKRLGTASLCMISMEDEDVLDRIADCSMLVSRVFASAAFRGHARSHRAMERVIARVENEDIELINPGRAHHFEIDKRLATETLCQAGICAPCIIDHGTPESLAPDAWDYPCIIKPNCGGRTTHTALLRSPGDAASFLDTAPDLEFIVEPYIEAAQGYLTRVEVVDGQVALVVKRSVAANGLSSYHEGSTYELYPDCPPAVIDAVLAAAGLLDIEFGSFDVIESEQGNFIIDANSVSNVSEDCTDIFDLDLMSVYADAIAQRYKAAQGSDSHRG